MSKSVPHLISGAASGFASAVCLQPINVLKTRVQQGSETRYLLTRLRQHVFLRVVHDIVNKEGPAALWCGTTVTLFRNVPSVSFYFAGLNYARSALAKLPSFAIVPVPATVLAQAQKGSVLPKLTGEGNLLAGAATRAVVSVAMNPFTVLKARYESNLYSYKSLFGALRDLARAGPAELFRGVVPSTLRDAPFAGISVVVYEQSKAKMTGYFTPTFSTHYMIIHGCSGMVAGTVATLATNPFDIVKTKVQVDREHRYQGLIQTASLIWRQRGISGFFDGAALRMTRKPLSQAIGWAVYEGVLMLIHA
ncbi:hypothetical protein CERSUDRAFT_107352 [Gelatoporia subvermispora B]|uniref:Solute carrier family 25 member 38 homolog n=1 Tax=Ceriporiopsis subvermispora (strain B) TaxID=914234 RepID=M2QCJ9_CERS8|nr:hypothetical protein CERSUDRAFT_107352 [Gelatoporia subvermispora B]